MAEASMRYYLAPLEGITRYIYRNAYHKYFTPMNRYFAPFLAPTQTGTLRHRELEDVLPEHNKGLELVPQILTNNADNFLWAARELAELGYREINLNLGCPSRTVVSRGRGAGFLSDPEKLDAFLWRVFQGWDGKISIKTRLGIRDPEEWDRLLRIYNQYPISELIVHPRLQKDYYQGKPDWAAFRQALSRSRIPLCYNGDIFTREDRKALLAAFPEIDTIMVGRGVLVNPALLRLFEQDELPSVKELAAFLTEIEEGYREIFSGETNVLFKLKEIWCYLAFLFPEENRYLKKIRKAQRLADYHTAVEAMFSELSPVRRRFS